MVFFLGAKIKGKMSKKVEMSKSQRGLGMRV
jgi:hypothetical protein